MADANGRGRYGLVPPELTTAHPHSVAGQMARLFRLRDGCPLSGRRGLAALCLAWVDRAADDEVVELVRTLSRREKLRRADYRPEMRQQLKERIAILGQHKGELT